ncbi:MAG: htpG [Deltaproteobacteria bacterium]|nr:htpG [Deltaproteobacteria bacterium]
MSERREFQAEVKQLLDLVVHSLYSDKDIFLRELVSNASDALDKLRFEQLTTPELRIGEPGIRIELDPEQRTLSIADNGIGMSRDEVVQNIGTIAKSGTKEFLAAVKEARKSEVPPELIGQFGVGFYSAFMVATTVTLVTRRAGQDRATRWESTGDGTYTIGDAERTEPGTTVTLQLRPLSDDEALADYTTESVIEGIIKRYSDFVGYPIRLGDRTLNSMKAIWDRPKAEVTETEYREFYRHISHDWTDPLRSIPVRMEGTIEAYALLYIPSKAPFDLYSAEMKRGLQLYVKRVFVMDECKELLPSYLRFVRGVVDAHDLSLNVSREILQKDRQIAIIRKQLVKKVLATLEDMKRDQPADYQKFWSELGPAVKEGMLSPDGDHDKLLDLVLAPSTAHPTEPTSLEQYVSRMKEGQEAIYLLTGASKETAARSPLLEGFVAKGYEVLLFTDPVDEIWLERAPRYKDKPLQSIAHGDVKLGSKDDADQASAALDQKQKEFGDLLNCLRVHLQDDIKEVRLSQRLTTSPACIVGDEHDPSPRLQRMMEQLGQPAGKIKRVLELNPGHALLPRLHDMFAASNADPRLQLYAHLLLGQAQLAESGQVGDPVGFAQALTELMLGTS